MDNTMEDVTPVLQQQLFRERQREREQLSEQLTALKSLLRLDADGIGEPVDLLDVIEETKANLDRFSTSVQRQGAINTARTPPVQTGGGGGIEGFQFGIDGEAGAGAGAEVEEPQSPERERRLSESSSTRSSWRSSPGSIASTAATSVSHRDSRRSTSSPPVFQSPSPYPGRYRGFGDIQDMAHDEYGHEDEEEDDDDDENDMSDASFERLSTILASLQQQAEAAVISSAPPTIEEEEEEEPETPLLWGDGGNATNATATSDHSLASTMTISYRRRSAPITPGLTPSMMLSMTGSGLPTAIQFPRTASGLRRSNAEQALLPPFSPVTASMPSSPRSSSSFAAMAGLIRRKTTTGVDGVTESTAAELDIEGMLTEFLELAARNGEQDMMFRWVWTYMLSGGIVWMFVGWFLGWGCSGCGETLACQQR
ncbi:hypothetical protein BZA05DRAFT_4525 [Tricharina praecox]|uniref:uncharacterized protein n=1 Tax=Tricharina praecox TaxID=43433 RepID=UPI00221E7084|nr:uncharacterized protein BZA05DRAFT_4525 [Tricharina praecox]KAI5858458.1 hypothetical protein BZA05DRAFT_4525 [Tricharina praecox]